jgi:hypothetical protein
MIDRTKLLPTSGIGVLGHWLVIAPADAPAIRLDLRLLDRVEIGPSVDEDNAHDSDPLDAEDPGSEVLLVCGELTVALGVAEGHEAAERIVAEAAALTGTRARDDGDALASVLVVDNTVVRLRGDFIQVGSVAFRIAEVCEYAEAGANLPLPDGRALQAAMAMLVVAAEQV